MKPLLLYSLAGVVIVTVLARQSAQLKDAGLVNRKLAAAVADLTNQSAASRDAIERLRHNVEDEQARHEELKLAMSEYDAKSMLPTALDDPTNGDCWPPGKSWCYLSKKDLSRFGFSTIDLKGEITDEAAAIFGLTPEERESLVAAFALLKRELFELDLSCLQLQPAGNSGVVERASVKKTSFKLSVPPAKSKEVYGRFEESVRLILKGARAPLFLEVEARHLDYWYQELKYPVLNLDVFTDETTSKTWSMKNSLCVDNPSTGSGVYFYPTDETAEGFAHYATLIDRFQRRE